MNGAPERAPRGDESDCSRAAAWPIMGAMSAVSTRPSCPPGRPRPLVRALAVAAGLTCGLAATGCLDFGARPADEGDASPPRPDAVDPTPDAAGSTPDAARPTPDAARPTPDAAGATPDAADSTPDAAGTPPDASGPTPDAAAATPDAAGSVPDAAPATPDAAPPPVGFCGGLGPFPQALTEGATLAEYLAGFADLPPTDPLQAPHHYGRVMADFDCDGRQDILLTRRGSATMTLLRGGPLRDGLPLLPGRLDVPLPPGFTSAFTATAADLNRDAVPELLVLARDNGLAGRLRVLVYPVDRATGAFGTPLVADVSRGLAAPNELNPDAGGPFPLSVVRKRSVERPSIVLLTLAEASVFTLPARDAQREWDAVRAERLIPDPAGGTAFSAAQAALPWPRPDGGEDLVVAEDVPGHRFRADALGWQRIWNGNLSAATHRIFVPFDADDDADVEFLAAFQHANGTDPIADVLEPAMPEGGAPFVVRPLVAQGVFSASGSWYAATATRADVDTPFDALFSGPAPGGHGLWLLPDITWDAVDRALHPTRPVAFRSFADFAPHHIFWGQFDGAPGLEAVLFDDATGLRCVRAALGVPGVAPDIVACE